MVSTNVSLPSTNPLISGVQNSISGILRLALPNPPDPVLAGLLAKNIQADPTTTKGMTVRIFNYSEFALNVAASSSQMSDFTPSAGIIPIKGWINLVLQFSAGNPSQEGTLTLTNADDSLKRFYVRAMITNTVMKVYVDWSTIATVNGLMMSPPPMTGTQNISIGLYEGSVYSLGIFRSDGTTQMPQVDPSTWKQDWMSTYSYFLNSQKMINMKIPGTHDAVSDNFAHETIDYQVKTQTQTLTQQLESGMRSFDLRVQKATESSLVLLLGVTLNSYYVTHGVFIAGTTANPTTTPVLLATALAHFKTFSDSHSNEVLILNFHQMRDSAQTSIATQQALITLIETELAGRMVPAAAAQYTYGQIIQSYAHPMRLIVSYNDSTVNNANFWAGVAQIAPSFDTGLFTRTQIYDHIKQQYDTNTYTTLSSAQAAQIRVDLGPMSMYYESEEFCSRLDVYQKLNICHVDFPMHGFLPEAMITMNGVASYKAPTDKDDSAILNATISFVMIGLISMFMFASDHI